MTGTETITDIILREIRELGESIILIDQHPSLISPALGNMYTTICFGLKHKADMNTISESLLLERDQVDFLGQFETGLAICKLQGRFFKPFIVRFPLFPVKKGMVTDKEIKEKTGSYSGESEVVRVGKDINRLIRSVKSLVNKEEGKVILTENERKFLTDIAKNPVSGVVARYSRMGINRYQGNKLQKELLDKKLIYWKPVSTQKGRLKVLVLTDKGKKAIPEVRIEKVFNKSGSWEHEYWKFRVGEYYRKKGYKVTFEYKIGEGKSVDVVAEKEGKKIAIEVETGKSDYVYNIKKDLDSGFDEVLIVVFSNSLKKDIMSKIDTINSKLLKKLNICLLSELSIS